MPMKNPKNRKFLAVPNLKSPRNPVVGGNQTKNVNSTSTFIVQNPVKKFQPKKPVDPRVSALQDIKRQLEEKYDLKNTNVFGDSPNNTPTDRSQVPWCAAGSESLSYLQVIRQIKDQVREISEILNDSESRGALAFKTSDFLIGKPEKITQKPEIFEKALKVQPRKSVSDTSIFERRHRKRDKRQRHRRDSLERENRNEKVMVAMETFGGGEGALKFGKFKTYKQHMNSLQNKSRSLPDLKKNVDSRVSTRMCWKKSPGNLSRETLLVVNELNKSSQNLFKSSENSTKCLISPSAKNRSKENVFVNGLRKKSNETSSGMQNLYEDGLGGYNEWLSSKCENKKLISSFSRNAVSSECGIPPYRKRGLVFALF